ncbi:hypothetical protein ACJMK2_011957 [Sinanodonta woodiana]|uniref:Mab-21-like HhH/H2TH-like domain-containing protein n=1 Tax=Sinanodonta woodiana TaxID=1069815 RepID=A0ABD3V6M9_SINWO
MDIPEYYEDMSLRLMKILDLSGLSEDLRWQRINTWLLIEDFENLFEQSLLKRDLKVCYFGSQVEGTTTDGLLSDIDKVSFLNSEVVLQDLQSWEASLDTKVTFLMVADESTPPGYVKLQLVQRDAPILVNNYQDDQVRLDSKHRSVLGNNTNEFTVSIANDHHGPACRIYNKWFTADVVLGLHTRSWPYQAYHWLSRSRAFNWPPRQIIDVIHKTGALLVPVGHTLSNENHLEWRLSFSFGEKLLTWKFNSTQYKCYMMLKFIKNTFINVGGREYLTSYHLKTCMFYLIENTPNSFWHPNKLLYCIDLCLKLLLSWIECNNCPNYFIPDENMFLGRIIESVQEHIARIVEGLLMQKGRYITRIHYQNIGENVLRMCMSLPMELDHPKVSALRPTFSFLAYVLDMLCVSVVVNNICNINVFTSSPGPRQEVFKIVRSLFCSSLGNHVASQSLEHKIPNKETLIMAHELLLWGCSSDVASGNLKLAAFYLSQNNLDAMENVLNHVNAKLTHTVFDNGALVLNESTLSQIPHDVLSIAKLLQHSFAFIVYYGSMDIHIIPKVLTFEIFRSTTSEPIAEPLLLNWIPIAAVGPSLYLYFLQYQCFHLQGRVVRSSVALNNMIWIYKQEFDRCMNCMTDDFMKPYWTKSRLINLSRATTALNLIASCLIQDRRLLDGFKVLCKSMQMTNQHNAAKWQIATFIIFVMRTSNVRQGL